MAARPGPAGGQAQERPVLRAVRSRLRDPRDARRTHPRLPGADLLERVLRPTGPSPPPVPVLRHRPVLRPVRAGAHRRHGGVVPGGRGGAERVPVRPRASDPRASRSRDARGRPPAGVRAGGQAPGSAHGRPSGAREPGDGALAARGPRRRRAGRGRPGGGVPGLLRPAGPGDGPQGMGGGPRRGPRPSRPRRFVPARAVHAATGRPATDPGARDPVGRRRAGCVARLASRGAGPVRRARARHQAQADGDGHAERARPVPAAQAPAGLGLRGAVARARRAREAPRARAASAADRVLRRLEPGSRRQGRLDGRVRGRPAQTERLSAVRDQGCPRTGRFRKHGGDAPPEAGAPAQGSGARSTAPVRLPTLVDRGRRWPRAALVGDQGPRRRRRAHPGDRAREAARGGLLPRPTRPARDPEGVGGAVRPSAPARRGAPVRDHVPPAEARQTCAGLSARRRRRGRAIEEEGAAEAVRLGGPHRQGERGRDRVDPRGRARISRARSTTGSPAASRPRGRRTA